MSRLFTFFEILSHNLAFVCAPPPTIHHRPYATLVLPTSARLSPRWGNTTLCAAIVCDNTPRSIARIAQTRYALHATAISLRSIRLRHALLPMRAIAHLCTAISLRSIRRASSAMRSIDCLHSIPPPTSPIYRPTAPTFSPLIARAPKTCPHHDKF